jgi:hypothetical protein
MTPLFDDDGDLIGYTDTSGNIYDTNGNLQVMGAISNTSDLQNIMPGVIPPGIVLSTIAGPQVSPPASTISPNPAPVGSTSVGTSNPSSVISSLGMALSGVIKAAAPTLNAAVQAKPQTISSAINSLSITAVAAIAVVAYFVFYRHKRA